MTDFLLMAFIFLCAGVVAVPIATRFGLGSVLGYLIAGIVISPALVLLNVDVVSIQHFAEFGVVMMLFLVGLELEPKMLWEMRHRLLGLGGFQVAGTAGVVMAVAMIFGQPWTIALAIGLVMALSSTAIVLQTLNEKGLMKSDGGQSSFSVLLFQDIAVIPMLALIPLLAMPDLMDQAPGVMTEAAQHAETGQGADAGHTEPAAHTVEDAHDDEGHGPGLSLVDGLNGWQTALVTVGAVAAVVLGGSFLTRPIFRFISGANLRELFTATALMMVVGIALLMSLVGLSPALGTFLAGVVLANSEYRHELESDIDPFKGLLLGLFFMTVGASINFGLLFENIGNIVAMTIGLMLAKVLVLLVLGRIFKLSGSDKWLFGLGLAQAGEFGFVLLSFTVVNQVIPQSVADQLLLVVAMSMLLTPGLFILFDKVIAPKYAMDQELEADEIDETGSIIIAGHGRVGGIVNRMLRGAGYETTVIDYSSAQLDMLRAFGVHVYYGDATRPDMLHAAGIHDAKVLVIAIDGKEQITELVRYVVKTYPNLHIIARAVDRNHVYELWAEGCRDIIRDTYDSSVRMGRSTIQALGIDRVEADRMAGEFEDMDRTTMVELANLFDVNIPVLENKPYMDAVNAMQGEWQEQLKGRMAPQGGQDSAPEPDEAQGSAVPH